MNKLLTQNAKMKKATLKTWNFDIPAITTCIGADKCKSYCYATKGFYKMAIVKAKHEANLTASKLDSFNQIINGELAELKAKDKIEAVRIHSSGDFYSREYLMKWKSLALDHNDLIFYCYTKSIPLFLGEFFPDNFRIIYSTGGKYDHLIGKHNLRSCSLVDNYTDGIDSSDDDDSMILFSYKNIELLKRKVI